MKNNTLTIVIIAVIVGAVSFFGGMQYQKSQRPQFGGITGQGNQMMGFGGPGGGSSGRGGRFGNGVNRPVTGKILSVDPTGITVKLMDGSSKIVILSDKTVINKTSKGSKSNLSAGVEITAFGTSNSDGSITAQNINIGGMIFRNFSPSGQPSPSK